MNNNFLSEQNIKRSGIFIDDYFSYLQEQWAKGSVSFKSYPDTLLTLADAYPFLSSRDKWEEIGYSVCTGIKEELVTNGIHHSALGMLGGLGIQAFAVNLYSKQTRNLPVFANFLNQLLLNEAAEKAEMLLQSNANNTSALDYDAIGGISGNLHYLLDFEWDIESENKIKRLAEYLVSLTHCCEYKGHEVLNFYISYENLFQSLQDEFPNGNFNFGLSHGMIGPLIALCKAWAKGVRTDDMDEAIEIIFRIYETFYVKRNGVVVWPAGLSYEAYLSGSCTDKDVQKSRASWCYGNVGIARGLQLAATYLEDKLRVKKYGEYLAAMIDQPVENFRLSNPCLCHGYASVMAIAMASDMDHPDPRITRSFNGLFTEALEVMSGTETTPYWQGAKFDMDYIIKDYFEEDTSFLQGPSGLVLSLLNVMHPGLEFGRLLMIK